MASKSSRRFTVQMVVVADAEAEPRTERQARDYIVEALSRWGGGGDPEDEFFRGMKVWKPFVMAIPMKRK